MFCKEDKTYCPPQISRPDYIRGFYYCVRYMTAYKDADICPNCGTQKQGRKAGRTEKKTRIEIDILNTIPGIMIKIGPSRGEDRGG